MRIKINLLFMFMILFSGSVVSQNDTVLSFTLPRLSILQNENRAKVIYEFENDYNSFILADSSLTADKNKYNYSVNIRDIKGITVKRSNSSIPITMGITFAVGFLTGAALAGLDFGGGRNVSGGERILSGFIGGAVFSLLGGSIAFLLSHDNSYELNEKDYSSKRKRLIEILKNARK